MDAVRPDGLGQFPVTMDEQAGAGGTAQRQRHTGVALDRRPIEGRQAQLHQPRATTQHRLQ